jgi:hypothetical protein
MHLKRLKITYDIHGVTQYVPRVQCQSLYVRLLLTDSTCKSDADCITWDSRSCKLLWHCYCGSSWDGYCRVATDRIPQTAAKRATNRQAAKQFFTAFPLWYKPLAVAVCERPGRLLNNPVMSKILSKSKQERYKCGTAEVHAQRNPSACGPLGLSPSLRPAPRQSV